MATIDDLDYKSISDMSSDEAIELLRQIRLSRRIPVTKKKTTKKSIKKSPKLTQEQAKKLLNMLEE